MQRDLSLVRDILMWAIDQEDAGFTNNPELPKYSDEEIAFHVHLMEQAGLVLAVRFDTAHDRCPKSIITSVTWDGYEFASAAKNNTLWNKAVKVVLKEGQSFTFQSLKLWLSSNLPGS